MALKYEIADMCKKCMINHRKNKKEFKVKCVPVPKELMESENPMYPLEKIFDAETIEQMTEREKFEIQMMKNKLMWAKEYLGWTSFHEERSYDQFYQREMLNCTAKLRTMRLGRRMGKCLEENSEVLTTTGYVKVKDLDPEKHSIYAFDAFTGKLVPTSKYYTMDNGEKAVYRIKTKRGNVDVSTFNHPYLVLEGTTMRYKNAEDIVSGDKIITSSNLIKKTGKRLNGFSRRKMSLDIASTGLIDDYLFELDHDSITEVLKNSFAIKRKHTFEDRGMLRKLKALFEMVNGDFYVEDNSIVILKHSFNSDIGTFEENFVYDEVETCEGIGDKKTIAVTVEEYSTFITDGLITHNTEVVTVDALHFAFNNPGKDVMIIGPFQNLIDEIFDRIAKLLDDDKSAFAGKYDRKRQPNIIRLNNGSRIKGYTTGLDGDSIRGQSAHRIYFDEAAYIPPTAFRSVLALLMDNPNVAVTATSTPSAVQTKFKDWCLTSPDWKEFHFQSTLFPYFHEIEETLRSTYTGDDFALEVLAEFIEGSMKVFRTLDIQEAKSNYTYISSRQQLERPSDWIISIGVDYNETKSGVQIIVLGFNKSGTSEKPFRVLNRISLHKETDDVTMLKNIQTRAVEMIKELYHSFQADYVYVDEGHGSMQNEILSEYFYKINRIHAFKGVDFSSNYPYEDIYTGETKNKRKKVMMVYFLQKRFEMREIEYSEIGEKEKGMLTTQLNEYSIDRYDSKDQPIFTGVDHILDALMLSVFAIIENCTSLFDRKTGNYVGSIKRTDVSNFSDLEYSDAKKNAISQLEKLSGNPYKDAQLVGSGLAGSGSLGNFGITSVAKSRKKRRFDEFDLF